MRCCGGPAVGQVSCPRFSPIPDTGPAFLLPGALLHPAFPLAQSPVCLLVLLPSSISVPIVGAEGPPAGDHGIPKDQAVGSTQACGDSAPPTLVSINVSTEPLLNLLPSVLTQALHSGFLSPFVECLLLVTNAICYLCAGSLKLYQRCSVQGGGGAWTVPLRWL